MKLELKHLVPYLPYGLKFYDILHEVTHNVVGIIEDEIYAKDDNGDCYSWYYKESEEKPILRPLSDLTKEIEIDGEKFVPIEWFEIGDDVNESLEYGNGNIKLIRSLESMSKYGIVNDVNYLPFGAVEKLFEWHFDVFGLIKNGLAIDINTINH